MAKRSLSSSSSNIEYTSWVIQIRNFLEDELDEEDNTTVCVFNVSKTLLLHKPEAYTPQFIALGPYHHWREDMYEMERYKLICAKRVQHQYFHGLGFQALVHELLKEEQDIRGCYDKFLDMDGETLAWMMAIDGLFLLDFLHIFVNKTQSVLASSARMSYLVGTTGRKLAYNLILKDIFMLENQIPTFVLKKILTIQCSSSKSAHNLLPLMFLGLCAELSPLKLKENFPPEKVHEHTHLLDLLYHIIVPNSNEQTQDDFSIKSSKVSEKGVNNVSSFDEEDKEVLKTTWETASKFKVIQKLKGVLTTRPIKVMLTLPAKFISKLPIVSVIAPMLESLLPFGHKENANSNSANSSKGDQEMAPLVEEIMIPSVSELCDAGVQFCPATGNISTIRFDKMRRKFYLPVVHLDCNTEVIIRNLVAYEASAISGPLVLARYMELMNGIVDSVEDVEILRQNSIIISRLKSDNEVAELWNGMTKAVRLSKVPVIDKAIRDANVYYNNTSKVKLMRMMKLYVYGSWRILIVLASIFLLGLMVMQSFCSIYNCPRFYGSDDKND